MESDIGHVANNPPSVRQEGRAGDESNSSKVERWLAQLMPCGRSIHDYKFEYGRSYHALKEGAYFMPNDESEQDRMDMQHRAFVLACGEKLYFAPVQSPKRVLDVGTGTGIWGVEFAQQMPNIEVVVGTDLSMIQPRRVPVSQFAIHIHDAEDQWIFPPNHFDFIHERFLISGSIKDHQKFFDQCFRHTTPGGYLEIQEMETNIRSDHYLFPQDSPLRQWTRELHHGIALHGRSLQPNYDEIMMQMARAGFIDIRVHWIKVPIGPWQKDRTMKVAGMIQLASILDGLEGMSLAPFTRWLGWQKFELDRLLDRVKAELMQKRACFYVVAAIIYGRKPGRPSIWNWPEVRSASSDVC